MLITSGNEIKIWDEENYSVVKEYEFENQIPSFSLKSTDSTILATTSDDEKISFINLKTDEITLYDDLDGVKSCSYDSMGKQLAIGLNNGLIDILDLKNNPFRRKSHKMHSNEINSICWSKQDRFIAAGSSNGGIAILNQINNQISKQLFFSNEKTPGVTLLTYSTYNATNLASSYDDGSIVYWDMLKEKPSCVFNKHESPATCCILSPISEMLMISGGLDNQLIYYDVKVKSVIKTSTIVGGITSLDMNKEGNKIAIGTVNGYVFLHDFRSKKEPYQSFKAHSSTHCVKFLEEMIPIRQQKTTKFSGASDTASSSSQLSFNMYSPPTHATSEQTRQSSTAVAGFNSSFVLHKTNNITPILHQQQQQLSTPTNGSSNLIKHFKNDVYSPVTSTSSKIMSPMENVVHSSAKLTLKQVTNGSINENNSLTPLRGSTVINQKEVKLNETIVTPQNSTVQPHTGVSLLLASGTSTVDVVQNQHQFGLQTVKEIVKDAVDELRDELMNENYKFKAEMLKEFMRTQQQIHDSFKASSVNESLVEEIIRLKEENKRLKKLF